MWFRVRVSNPSDHVTHWLCDHVMLKKTLSAPSLGQWPPILARCDWSRVDHNHRVTWLICHVITLYSQKCASPVSQRQWPLNLVGLWVRMKRLHLLFQVTCRSSDHVLFEKCHASINARLQNSDGYSKHRKPHKSIAFFVVQKIFKFDLHWYAPL